MVATRQTFEVCGLPSGPARAGRQAVEVLCWNSSSGTTWNDTVIDTLTLAESNTVTSVPARATSDSLVLTESNSLIVKPARAVSDSLTLTESNTVTRARGLSAQDSLAFNEALALNQIRSVGYTDSLALTEATIFGRIRSLGMSDSVVLSEQGRSAETGAVLLDTLVYTELYYRPAITSVSAADTVSLFELFRSNLAELAFADTLGLIETFDTRVRGRTITDALQLAEKFDCSGWVDASDKLSLAETFVIKNATVTTADRITLTDAWHESLRYSRITTLSP